VSSTTSAPSSEVPVVAVTGAGSGIGAATAIRFANEGWDVVLMGRRPEPLTEVANKIGSRATVFTFDVSDADSFAVAQDWARKNISIANRFTSVIHNAGIYEQATTLESSNESWHRIFETNLFGVIRLTQAFYPFLKQNRGSITTVSSTLGLRPTANTPAYSASKAALINWGHSFAKEAAPDRVRVNCLCPGVVDTPIHAARPGALTATSRAEFIDSMGPYHPLGRVGRPEEIAHMIWALSGPGSEWTTGAIVNVDGGIGLV
jgi:NAD(P)-dependent dehydrogenase (short-subunit alcohol dehydrogenase family)